jgi:hypothetical protein
MRYSYKVKEKGTDKEEMMEAMSWKKFLKSFKIKYPKFTGSINYVNKKNRNITRSFRNGKENTYGDNQYDFV